MEAFPVAETNRVRIRKILAEDFESMYSVYSDADAMWVGDGARAMLQYGETKQGLDQIFATIHSDHQASKRVAMKAGMKHVDSRTEDDGSVTEVYCNRP